MENKKVKFLAAVPVELEAKLRDEASQQRRNRNAQLVRILEERYGLTPTNQPAEEAQPARTVERAA